MSPTTTDEQTTELVAELRRKAAVGAPHTTWDAPTVIAAGRRRRRWQTARRSVGVAAVVVACAVALPVLLDRPDRGTVAPATEPTSAAPDTGPLVQEPRQVEVAPGVVASIGAARSDGSVDLGRLAATSASLISDDAGSGPLHAELHVEGPQLAGGFGVFPLDDGVGAPLGVWVLDAKDNPSDKVQLDRSTGRLAGPLEATSVFDPARGLIILSAGAAPTTLRDARVFLFATTGLLAGDGSGVHVVEIPTFAVPSGLTADSAAAARWFALEATGPAADGFAASPGGFAFAGADGTIVVPGCLDLSEAACEARTVPGLFEDVRGLLAEPSHG
ncbi:hypothetical protein Cch01nite_06390 [Cellulomonas chitinilytica]|uniref:Uncharacterized protein n=1 Tax=Cellulomonas chitinilytica TaxID=398759 RepID=A0A919NZK0_9CELL|nr:hypothetical protein [Cellulomonas chitinilytica]GIG19915.1 hypothetical protein Cch01nite_06390 [Cellulomonas chitinilytica]